MRSLGSLGFGLVVLTRSLEAFRALRRQDQSIGHPIQSGWACTRGWPIGYDVEAVPIVLPWLSGHGWSPGSLSWFAGIIAFGGADCDRCGLGPQARHLLRQSCSAGQRKIQPHLVQRIGKPMILGLFLELFLDVICGLQSAKVPPVPVGRPR
jgi:hypothetical protein